MKKPGLSIHPSEQPTPRGRQRLKSLTFIPALLTLGNLLCGFAAIHFAATAMRELGMGVSPEDIDTLGSRFWERMLPSSLSLGAGLVILGMVLDCADGLIARATRNATTFGGQLDSLADVVTFGVAPATLMVALMTNELAGDSIIPSPISPHFLGRVTWVAAAIYVAFVAIRLARFNVEHAKADADYRTFQGLPSPGAAIIISALIVFQAQMGDTARTVIVYTMPIAALSTAFLMVSRIPYKRFYRAYLLGRQPFGQFVVLILLLAVFWLYKAPMLLVIVLWYGVSGPLFLLVRSMQAKRGTQQPTASDELPSQERKPA